MRRGARGDGRARVVTRAARESELAGARASSAMARAADLRAREQELAGLHARLASLEELDAARAGYGDGRARVLARGRTAMSVRWDRVADYLEVDRGYERAVEACLGDLLQHVVVAVA